jgi:hypothetical protein
LIKKIILSILFLSSVVSADFFDKGSLSVGVVAGSGSSDNNSYVIAGVNGDYFIMDGLSVGVGYRAWLGNDSTQHQFTLSSTYYIPIDNNFHPYIGLFGRETIVENFNISSYGGRVGFVVAMSQNSYAGVGYVYEEYTECKSFMLECSSSYPEFVFSLSF